MHYIVMKNTCNMLLIWIDGDNDQAAHFGLNLMSIVLMLSMPY